MPTKFGLGRFGQRGRLEVVKKTLRTYEHPKIKLSQQFSFSLAELSNKNIQNICTVLYHSSNKAVVAIVTFLVVQ